MECGERAEQGRKGGGGGVEKDEEETLSGGRRRERRGGDGMGVSGGLERFFGASGGGGEPRKCGWLPLSTHLIEDARPDSLGCRPRPIPRAVVLFNPTRLWRRP